MPKTAATPKPAAGSATVAATIQPAGQAEPDISDALPEGAEVVEDDAALTAILNRFYPGGETSEDSTPPTPPKPTATADGTAGTPSTDPQSAAAAATEGEPAAEPPPASPATFTAEQEAEIERRIAEARAQVEPLQAELAAERARAEALQEKLSGQTNPPPAPKEIHPLLLTDDLADIEKRQRRIDEFLDWAAEHPNGYEAAKEGEESWTPEQIRKTQRQLEREDRLVLPEARALIQERARHRAMARTQYPELFNPKSQDYQIRKALLDRAPWLRAVFPQIELWVGHMIAGERLLKAKARPAAAPAKPLPKPPVPSASAAPPAGGPKPPKRGVNELDAEEFVKRGATRSALVDMIKENG